MSKEIDGAHSEGAIRKKGGELNPNNPMVKQLREHWQKLASLLVHKYGEKEITSDGKLHTTVKLTPEDCRKFIEAYKEMPAIVLDEAGLDLVLIVESLADAEKRAKGRGISLEQ